MSEFHPQPFSTKAHGEAQADFEIEDDTEPAEGQGDPATQTRRKLGESALDGRIGLGEPPRSNEYWVQNLKTFRSLPRDFLDTFIQTNLSLDVIREQVRRVTLRPFIWAGPARYAAPFMAEFDRHFSDALGAMAQREQTNTRRLITTIFTRIAGSFQIARHPDWQPADEMKHFCNLAGDYIEDTLKIHQLGLPGPGRIALHYSPEWCLDFLQTYADVPNWVRHAVFDKRANPEQIIERFASQIAPAQEKYKNYSELSPSVIQRLVFLAACKETGSVDATFDAYLEKYYTVQELTVRLRCVQPYDVQVLSLAADPHRAVKKLEERLDRAFELAKKYRLTRRLAEHVALRYRKDLEDKAKRLRACLDKLSEIPHPDLLPEFIQAWVMFQPEKSYELALRYLEDIALLRRELGDHADFDDTVFQQIAFHYPKRPMHGATHYLQIYAELRERFADDEVVEDWMLRLHASRPGRQLGRLIAAAKQGYFVRSFSTAGGSDIADRIVSNYMSPENEYIAEEDAAKLRGQIQALLANLNPFERAATIHAFELDWPSADERVELEVVCRELTIKPESLREYVKRHILPKLSDAAHKIFACYAF